MNKAWVASFIFGLVFFSWLLNTFFPCSATVAKLDISDPLAIPIVMDAPAKEPAYADGRGVHLNEEHCKQIGILACQGVAWHEIGHIVLGHVYSAGNTREKEDAADAYAGEHATREQLAALIGWHRAEDARCRGAIICIYKGPHSTHAVRAESLTKIFYRRFPERETKRRQVAAR